MTSVHVALGPRSYDITVGSALLPRAADLVLATCRPTSVAVLTHPRLLEPYARPIIAGLEAQGVRAFPLVVPAGERYKNLRTVEGLYNRLVAEGVDRKGLIVTVGGGVLGDVGGFVAATYLRGIAFVQAPTTLLAQVDASVGGKTGVDLPGGKNLVGAFHQPLAVLIDLDTLGTLLARELRSGLAEVIKYGIISDKGLFARLSEEIPRLLRRDPEALAKVVESSCRIKADVVAKDETEQGLRAILNFGHTIGHAIEGVTQYRRYKHGEAISIGMVSACLIGEAVGLTPASVTREVSTLLERAKLPVVFPADLDPAVVLNATMSDKKRVGGRLTFVLAREIGAVELRSDVPAEAVLGALRRQQRLSEQ